MKTVILLVTEPVYRWYMYENNTHDTFNGGLVSAFAPSEYEESLKYVGLLDLGEVPFDFMRCLNKNIGQWEYTSTYLKCEKLFNELNPIKDQIFDFLKKPNKVSIIHTSSTSYYSIVPDIVKNYEDYKSSTNEQCNLIKVYCSNGVCVDDSGYFDYKITTYGKLYKGQRTQEEAEKEVQRVLTLIRDLAKVILKKIEHKTDKEISLEYARYILPENVLGDCPICGAPVYYHVNGEKMQYMQPVIACTKCNFLLINELPGGNKDKWHELIEKWVHRNCIK